MISSDDPEALQLVNELVRMITQTNAQCPEPKRRTLALGPVKLNLSYEDPRVTARPVSTSIGKGTITTNLVATLAPALRVELGDLGLKAVPMDKVLHGLEYLIFGVLLFRAFHRGAELSLGWCVFCTAFFAAAFALSDETHQFFVGRDCEWGDLVADSMGGVLGACAMAFFYSRFHTRMVSPPT